MPVLWQIYFGKEKKPTTPSFVLFLPPQASGDCIPSLFSIKYLLHCPSFPKYYDLMSRHMGDMYAMCCLCSLLSTDTAGSLNHPRRNLHLTSNQRHYPVDNICRHTIHILCHIVYLKTEDWDIWLRKGDFHSCEGSNCHLVKLIVLYSRLKNMKS